MYADQYATAICSLFIYMLLFFPSRAKESDPTDADPQKSGVDETPRQDCQSISPTGSSDSGYDSARSYERNPTIRALLFEMSDKKKQIDSTEPGTKKRVRMCNGFDKIVEK